MPVEFQSDIPKEEVLKLLKELEWVTHWDNEMAWGECPICKHESRKHYSDCELDKMIKRLEAK